MPAFPRTFKRGVQKTYALIAHLGKRLRDPRHLVPALGLPSAGPCLDGNVLGLLLAALVVADEDQVAEHEQGEQGRYG